MNTFKSDQDDGNIGLKEGNPQMFKGAFSDYQTFQSDIRKRTKLKGIHYQKDTLE